LKFAQVPTAKGLYVDAMFDANSCKDLGTITAMQLVQPAGTVRIKSPSKAAISKQGLNRVTFGGCLGAVGQWENRGKNKTFTACFPY
jgi:hypothetical protein